MGVLQQADFSFLWGIGIPAFIFLVAFAVTWFLYRHFASKK